MRALRGGRRGARGRSRLLRLAGTTPLAFEPDVYSYQHYISTLVKENGQPKGSLDELDAVLLDMKQRGVSPKGSIFTPYAWLAFSLNDWAMGKVRPGASACASRRG